MHLFTLSSLKELN